jgi:S-adenosylmethionine:tRNA ribosyltransferase-isomerase
MFLADFDYELPDELIARHPTPERAASRLLVVGRKIDDQHFVDLPAFLNPGDLLVFNNTRVIHARLHGRKETGGKVEILIERIQSAREALAQIRASKSPRAGNTVHLDGGVTATVTGRQDNMYLLSFSAHVHSFLEEYGEVPLPPYLGRDADSADDERYQTVYAKHPGAVAAPTAGLHFDDSMLNDTASAGVAHEHVTLHVGAGTFQPLRKEQVEANRLHAERVVVGESVCAAVTRTRESGKRVIAVGTTTVRALESAALSGQIKPYDGETDIFITPGYRLLPTGMRFANGTAFSVMVTPCCCCPSRHEIQCIENRGRGPGRRNRIPARHSPDAGLHASWNLWFGQEHDAGRSARWWRGHHSRKYLSPDVAPGHRCHSPTRRPA